MKRTEFTYSSNSLPALIVFARINSLVHFFILSEIKSFSRVNFRSNCLLEVLIRNFPISIVIELPKKVFKLVISDLKTPMLEIKPELIRFDIATFLFIKVTKGFPDSFPLKLHLLKDHLEQLLILNILSYNLSRLLHHFLFLFHV